MRNYTNITVANLRTHNLMTFSTIVMVFTIVICSYIIVILEKFDYHPALMCVCTCMYMDALMCMVNFSLYTIGIYYYTNRETC